MSISIKWEEGEVGRLQMRLTKELSTFFEDSTERKKV
jgi:hypothetical protein